MVDELKRGFGLFLWSDLHGQWWCVTRCEDRERLEPLRDQLLMILGISSSSFFIVEAETVEAVDLLRVADATLRPPLSAQFVDPAPDGVFEPSSSFDGLLDAIGLHVEFSQWRSEAFWQSEGEAVTVDDALRLLFLDRHDRLDRWLGPDPTHIG